MNIVFLGKPGSGKGTQNKLISEQFNMIPVIAGDILRDEKKSGSKLGRKISSLIDKGNLVPDGVIDNLVEKYLEYCALDYIQTGFIFDGYPRTIKQGENLDEIMDMCNTKIDIILFLEVPEKTLIERILERGKTSGREDDQDIDIIKQRMKNYDDVTKPLINYYKNKLVIIDGTKSIEDINIDIKKVLIRMLTQKIKKR